MLAEIRLQIDRIVGLYVINIVRVMSHKNKQNIPILLNYLILFQKIFFYIIIFES